MIYKLSNNKTIRINYLNIIIVKFQILVAKNIVCRIKIQKNKDIKIYLVNV